MKVLLTIVFAIVGCVYISWIIYLFIEIEKNSKETLTLADKLTSKRHKNQYKRAIRKCKEEVRKEKEELKHVQKAYAEGLKSCKTKYYTFDAIKGVLLWFDMNDIPIRFIEHRGEYEFEDLSRR